MNLDLDIIYSHQALKFLKKNKELSKTDVQNLLAEAVKLLFNLPANIDLKKLKGKLNERYRIRNGNIRIIFTYQKGELIIVTIETIDYRGNVY